MLKKNYLVSLVVLSFLMGCGANNSNNEKSNSLTFSEKFDTLSTNLDELSSSYNESYDARTDYYAQNSMEYKGNDAYTNKRIDKMIEKLKDYRKTSLKSNQNNNKTSHLDNELNIYFLSLKKEFENSSNSNLQKTSASLDRYIRMYLNPMEYSLYQNNPAKALLCMRNGKLAIEITNLNYKQSSVHNGNGDAFKHALWNYAMSQDVGIDFTKEWADAHENDTTIVNPWHEKTMDLYNNRVGRILSTTVSYRLNIWEMTAITKKAVRSGKMITTDLEYFYYSNTNGEK